MVIALGRPWKQPCKRPQLDDIQLSNLQRVFHLTADAPMTAAIQTHLAQIYLGNRYQAPQLAEQLAATPHWQVTLTPSDRAKGRIYAQTSSGESVGIVKERHWNLADGDVFETVTGELLLVHLEPQRVMLLRMGPTNLDAPALTPGQVLALIHLGHCLGNHHWPILVEADRIYVELVSDPAVMESTLAGFAIPGLEISYELRSPDQPLTFSAHSHP
jgi:urease accessory protein